MGKAHAEVTIERSADDVWKRIRGFAELDWYVGVESCRLEGDIRICRMVGIEMEIDEQLVDLDDDQRTYAYAVVEFRGGDTHFPMPSGEVVDLADMVGHHQARITVVPEGPSRCRVDYDLEIDDGHDKMLDGLRWQYQTVIDHLKQEFEG